MRRPRPDNLFQPAVLLALSITLCGGSLYAGNHPGAGVLLPQRLADRATELTVGQRETVAQLMQFLADAAKELQKHDGKAVATAEPVTARATLADREPDGSNDPAPPRVRLVELHHLDLPPPAATL